MLRSCTAIALTVALVVPALPASASDQAWSPPVDGPVVRGYEPPQKRFGRRHLGVDFSAEPTTPVRAAGDGVVAFAGRVGRSRAVAVEHAAGRRTTYAYLSHIVVRPGLPVHRGDILGLSGGEGPGHDEKVVHFGYRVNGRPQDPAPLFKPSGPRISLAPIDSAGCRYTDSRPGHPRSAPRG